MLTMQLRNQIENALCRADIEIARGLVGKKQLWFRDQGSGQRDSLLLAAGKLAGAMMNPVSQSHFAQPFGCTCLSLLGIFPAR